MSEEKTTETAKHVDIAVCQVKKKLALGGGIIKDRNASMGAGGSYNFRGIDDVYNVLCGMTADLGLALYPRVVDKQIDYQTNDRGKVQTHYHVTMDVDLVSAIDGTERTIRSLGEAIDTGDKGSGKAQSYAMKMACIMAFQIPTHGEMDTEAYHNEVGPAFTSKADQVPAMVAAAKADPLPVAAIQQEPAKRTRGPNKPKPDPVPGPGPLVPDERPNNGAAPDEPFPAHAPPGVTTEVIDDLVGRIANVQTFPLLHAIAQDAETATNGSPDRDGVFAALKARAIHLFGEAKNMAGVQEGFEIVNALGQPDDVKAAANKAYARFRNAGAAR
jgi:hypothetical protein